MVVSSKSIKAPAILSYQGSQALVSKSNDVVKATATSVDYGHRLPEHDTTDLYAQFLNKNISQEDKDNSGLNFLNLVQKEPEPISELDKQNMHKIITNCAQNIDKIEGSTTEEHMQSLKDSLAENPDFLNQVNELVEKYGSQHVENFLIQVLVDEKTIDGYLNGG